MKRLLLLSTILIAGCATQQQQPVPAVEPYIPAAVTTPPPKPIDVGPDPLAQLPEAIRIAFTAQNTAPIRQGITTIYPYDAHGQPTLNCQIFRLTEIVLSPDETVQSQVGIGDKDNWALLINAHSVAVKPLMPGISTDLIIVTNLRSYHFTLRTRTPYQPQIAFYYPDDIRAAESHHRDLIRQAVAESQAQPWSKPLNFGYIIEGPAVAWKPVLAFDDGDHFYIEFPQNVSGTDMPSLMAQQGKQSETVNYAVRGQYYVADRLLPAAVLTSGTGANRQAVQITARR